MQLAPNRSWYCSALIGRFCLWLLSLASTLVLAQPAEVALAGLAFAGDAASSKERFPYSVAYERSQSEAGKPVFRAIREATGQHPPQHLQLVSQIDELRGRQNAIAVALVVSAETISVERIAGLHKLFVQIRGQALFFDFKLMTVVRAYPLSFAHIDVFDRAPTQREIAERVRMVYEGAAGKPGIINRFATTLATAKLPADVSRFLQVTAVDIRPAALQPMPEYLKADPAVAQTWAADLISEALSNRAGVPLIPFAKGYAIGNVMSLRISDGRVYELKLPKPDYEITAEITDLRKIKFSESVAGTSFIYGSYASLRIVEPLTGKTYLNTALKNGETKSVPVTQSYVDDFPAFHDAIHGLFAKLSDALDGRGRTDWLKSAAAAPDIDKQISLTKELLKLCK